MFSWCFARRICLWWRVGSPYITATDVDPSHSDNLGQIVPSLLESVRLHLWRSDLPWQLKHRLNNFDGFFIFFEEGFYFLISLILGWSVNLNDKYIEGSSLIKILLSEIGQNPIHDFAMSSLIFENYSYSVCVVFFVNLRIELIWLLFGRRSETFCI